MKKLLLIGICLIVLSSFASALIDSTGFVPELDGMGDNLYPQPVLLGSGDGVAPIKYLGGDTGCRAVDDPTDGDELATGV